MKHFVLDVWRCVWWTVFWGLLGGLPTCDATVEEFFKIGLQTKCDKVTQHSYHLVYPLFLSHIRHQKLRVLEIGLNHGRSAQTWRQYLPNAELHYVEVSHKYEKYAPPGTHVYIGSQGNVKFLQSLIKKLGPFSFDIIIDDGGHQPYLQQVSFMHLFDQLLRPGGLYFIEDTEFSYDPRNGGGPPNYLEPYGSIKDGKLHGTTIGMVKAFIDVINRQYFNKRDSTFTMPELGGSMLTSLHVFSNVVAVTKSVGNHSAPGSLLRDLQVYQPSKVQQHIKGHQGDEFIEEN